MIHFDMKPAARIERGCWILSQLFDGYDGYVYEVINRFTEHVLFHFAFKGKVYPIDVNDFETVLNFEDGIYWLKNYCKNN